MIGGLLARLRDVPGVVRIEPAGSLRRRKATIGDLDLLAATESPQELIAVLDGLTEVDRILSAGTDKSSIVLGAGLQVDLMVCPPAAWGTHLVHFTGSKEHNVTLRGMALDRGLSPVGEGLQGGRDAASCCWTPPRRRSTPGWTCPGSRRRCARTPT